MTKIEIIMKENENGKVDIKIMPKNFEKGLDKEKMACNSIMNILNSSIKDELK
jgi:hypothetical protein